MSDTFCQVISYHVDNIFIDLARLLLQHGIKVSPRKSETLELRNICFKLLNPKNCLVSLPSRNISKEYLEGEMQWYKSGSLLAKDIEKYSSFWKNISNSDGTLNSNYGYFVMKQLCPNDQTQLQWCVNKIKDDPDTRQAIINYNQVMHKYNNNKDFVCTISQSFRQHDGVIDTFVHMRSNDLIYGLTYDMVWYCYVLEELCKLTGYKPGAYYHFTESLHVYKRHYEMLEDIAHEKKKKPEVDIDNTIILLDHVNTYINIAKNLLQNISSIDTSVLYKDGIPVFSSIFDMDDNTHICDLMLNTNTNKFIFTIFFNFNLIVEIYDKKIIMRSEKQIDEIDIATFGILLSKFDVKKVQQDIEEIKNIISKKITF